MTWERRLAITSLVAECAKKRKAKEKVQDERILPAGEERR